MAVAVLNSTKFWVCPNCDAQDKTTEAQPHTRYHSCPGLGMISAPMVPKGISAAVTAVVREDYIGTENALIDNKGRPIMAVLTTRDDGQDVAVMAPTAKGKAGR